jgi:pyridoxamine 5'-phosphate oxidase
VLAVGSVRPQGRIGQVIDPAALRHGYLRGALREEDLASTWSGQLSAWFAEAVACPEVLDASAMQLATADEAGRPSVRTVLARSLDADGVTFYTNYASAKARDLAIRPYAAAVFTWLALERQVRLSGSVTMVSRAETEAYFAGRPPGSQIAAWASPQSAVIGSRAELEALVQEVAARFPEGTLVPAPPGWGGYRLQPELVEFWQGRADRLHDRLQYRRSDAAWVVERLAP